MRPDPDSGARTTEDQVGEDCKDTRGNENRLLMSSGHAIISPKFTQEIDSLWDYRKSTEQYAATGGTSKQSVMEQIHELGLWLQAWRSGSC